MPALIRLYPMTKYPFQRQFQPTKLVCILSCIAMPAVLHIYSKSDSARDFFVFLSKRIGYTQYPIPGKLLKYHR